MRADWQHVGVAVDTRHVAAGILLSDNAQQGVLRGRKFDVALFSYGQIRADGIDSSFTCANAAPAGQNYSRICDKRLAQEIRRRINDLLPAIIIAKRNEYHVIRDTITGYRPKPFFRLSARSSIPISVNEASAKSRSLSTSLKGNA